MAAQWAAFEGLSFPAFLSSSWLRLSPVRYLSQSCARHQYGAAWPALMPRFQTFPLLRGGHGRLGRVEASGRTLVRTRHLSQILDSDLAGLAPRWTQTTFPEAGETRHGIIAQLLQPLP